jgi:hypothetical protein
MEVIPASAHIDLTKPLRTRSGYKVIHPELVLHNGAGREVTYPIKGSILVPGRREPRFCIWSLDGRTQVVHSPVRDDDLVECDITREELSYEVDKYGYMLKFRGKNIGGAGTDRDTQDRTSPTTERPASERSPSSSTVEAIFGSGV